MDNMMMENVARVNVTWNGRNGDLADPVFRFASDADVRRWVTEAVQGGGVRGIPQDRGADFRDYVIDRFEATPDRPYALIQVRPRTPFG